MAECFRMRYGVGQQLLSGHGGRHRRQVVIVMTTTLMIVTDWPVEEGESHGKGI